MTGSALELGRHKEHELHPVRPDQEIRRGLHEAAEEPQQHVDHRRDRILGELEHRIGQQPRERDESAER